MKQQTARLPSPAPGQAAVTAGAARPDGAAAVSPRRDGRKENAAATQAALCAAGRALFGTVGYEASSVAALCERAGVTAGALYHHYRDKKGLFAAVAEQLDAELARRAGAAVAEALARGDGAWDAFLAGVDTMLAAGNDAGARRIGLADAAAVLGADVWLAIRERHGLGAMMAAVGNLQAAGVCAPGQPRRLARIALGMLYGAIEALPDDSVSAASAMAETRRVTHAMLATLRA